MGRKPNPIIDEALRWREEHGTTWKQAAAHFGVTEGSLKAGFRRRKKKEIEGGPVTPAPRVVVGDDRLSQRQWLYVWGLMEGLRPRDIEREIGIPQSTQGNWKRDPDVRAVLAGLQRDRFDASAARLRHLYASALHQAGEYLKHDLREDVPLKEALVKPRDLVALMREFGDQMGRLDRWALPEPERAPEEDLPDLRTPEGRAQVAADLATLPPELLEQALAMQEPG